MWKNFVLAARDGLPLVGIPCELPIFVKCFVSDAAGVAIEWKDGQWKNCSENSDRAVASIEFNETGLTFAGGAKWPPEQQKFRKDRNGKFFGTKSTFLETVGLLVPFVTKPKKVKNKFVRLFVDNTNVIYGWERCGCASDAETLVLFRALHLLDAKLECKIFVEHMRRMSTPEAELADHLTHASTTTAEDWSKIEHLE